MTTMRTVFPVLVVAVMFGGVAGCGPVKEPAITELQRKEAAHLASEAQFALTVRDYPRAEGELAKATALTPDDGDLWVSLGATRMKLGKRAAAKEAYQAALRAYEAEAKKNPGEPEPWLKQVYALALLGRQGDGRALSEKAAKQFPGSREVKGFIESRELDRMVTDPAFKEMAL